MQVVYQKFGQKFGQKIFQTLCLILFLGTFGLLVSSPAMAVDVCCISFTKGDGFQASAGPESDANCKAGKKSSSGATVCGASGSLDQCASLSPQQLCSACGAQGWNWIEPLKICSDKKLEDLVPKKETPPSQ